MNRAILCDEPIPTIDCWAGYQTLARARRRGAAGIGVWVLMNRLIRVAGKLSPGTYEKHELTDLLASELLNSEWWPRSSGGL